MNWFKTALSVLAFRDVDPPIRPSREFGGHPRPFAVQVSLPDARLNVDRGRSPLKQDRRTMHSLANRPKVCPGHCRSGCPAERQEKAPGSDLQAASSSRPQDRVEPE